MGRTPLTPRYTNTPRYTKIKAFTLIELMLVVAVLSILLGIGIPNFNKAIKKALGKTITLKLYTAYQYTRHEAAKRSKELILCGSDDGVNCIKQWHKHLIAFDDLNNNKKVDPNEQIRTFEFNYNNVTLLTKFASGTPRIFLFPDGSSAQNGAFIYCRKNDPEATRKINFNRAGRPYFAALSFSKGQVSDTDDRLINCP